MNRLNLMKSAAAVYLEIGQSTLRALQGEQGLDLPLERLPNGRLSSSCKQTLSHTLQTFFRKEPWRPHLRALCAICARGVSLRRVALPVTSKENLPRLLLLQIESEFPLSPDDLAWGYLPLTQSKAGENGSPGQQEYLIAAVKKEVIEEYTELLAACGLNANFTVAAIARQGLCPDTLGSQALLDIGRHYSELISFEDGVPRGIRVLPWGGETITRAIEQGLGITRTEAEELKLKFAQGQISPELAQKVHAALQKALDALAKTFNGYPHAEKLYLTGQSVCLKGLAAGLAQRLAPGVTCEPIEAVADAGCSAATVALRSATERANGRQPLLIRGKQLNGSNGVTRPAPWKQVALAACLAGALLTAPYLEAIILKPFLARRLAALKEGRQKLALIDAEWGFFQHLKQNAPPYLDALFLLAKAAPQGARIESLSMNRRGDLSMRCSMQNPQQVTDFRSKLIDSGFFANVTVEEQAPSPDRQKLAVRMSAQWKPLSARQALAFGPTAEEIEKAKTRVREPQMGGGPMMPMMGGPGMPGPMPALPVSMPPPGGPAQRTRVPRANPPTEAVPGPPSGPPPVNP